MEISNKNKITTFIFCFFIALIPFLIYAHTLCYPWKLFDEQIIYNETLLPVPRSISELFEYIKHFGVFSFIESSNPFYSSISNVRSLPVDNFLNLFVFYFFQKNPFNYHLLSLILHIFNTVLLFFLLKTIYKNYESVTNKKGLFLISVLTLTWSLHPANAEAVLFTTNWSALLTYFLCFTFLLSFITTYQRKMSLKTLLLMIVLFIITQSTREYPIVIPLILFFYSCANYQHFNKNISLILYLFIISGMFIFFVFSTPAHETAPLFERVFWFSPQIFLHYIKLLIFPLHLTIDQTTNVIFSNQLFDPYSISCTIIMCFFVTLLLISILNIKKNIFYLTFISLSPFLLALLPFLHLLSPSYCLASERYLYFPLFMLVFGISHVVFFISTKHPSKLMLVILCTLLCFYGIRTYERTFDWKDSISLFTSSLNKAQDDLSKGLKKQLLGTLYMTENKATSLKLAIPAASSRVLRRFLPLAPVVAVKEVALKLLALIPRGKPRGFSLRNYKILGERYLNDAVLTLQNHLINLESKKSNDKSPDIIKFYGLDPLSLQAKTAYLLAYTKLGLNHNLEEAYLTLSPFMKDLKVLDTQILDFYLGILFATNHLEEAEKLVTYANSKRLSPITLYIISELYFRSNDLTKAEQCLKKSFEYFPYNLLTLLGLKKLYGLSKNLKEYAYYSYLYALRTHDIKSQEEYKQILKTL